MAAKRQFDHQYAFELRKQGLSFYQISLLVRVNPVSVFNAIKRIEKKQEKGGENVEKTAS